MRLLERHVIKRAAPRFTALDRAACASKHLYNKALDATRQAFCQDGSYPSYPTLYHHRKGVPEYAALPRKVAQGVLKQVCTAWESYKVALAAWGADPSKCVDQPRIPRYKPKQQGRNLLVYPTQALSQPAWRHSRICPSGLDSTVQTQQSNVHQVRIIPRLDITVAEVIYAQEPVQAKVDPALQAGVDIGLNTLAWLTSDQPGFVPRLVNGRPVKSSNQVYNKRQAELQSRWGDAQTRRRLERLPTKRTQRGDWYLHTASRRIIDLLVAAGIGTRCIGTSPLWKQQVNRGRRNKQNFVSVPHARCIAMLTYQAELVGIRVCVTEASYTSKASFLDGDPLPIYDPIKPAPTFSGRRVKRGLYRAADGRHINADANGSSTTMRTVAPEAFAQGRSGCVVHPVRLAV